jgi:hypothetical protein
MIGTLLVVFGIVLSIVSLALLLPKFSTEKTLLLLGRWDLIDGEPANAWASEFDRRNASNA